MYTKHDGEEVFIYSEYSVAGEKPSKIVPGYMHKIEAFVGCPRCRTLNLPLEHGEESKCGVCGLNMRRFGNTLHVWL